VTIRERGDAAALSASPVGKRALRPLRVGRRSTRAAGDDEGAMAATGSSSRGGGGLGSAGAAY
jgi:hypothetical protein